MTHLDYLRTLAPRVLYWVQDGPDLTDGDIAFDMPTETCRTCGDVWHFESDETFTNWSSFHSQCAEAPCDLCGQPTNTPDACFECYHAPFGVGWEQDAMERMFA